MGFALVFGGASAVVWYEPIKDFPYVAGVVPVVISWFLSPLLAALITFVLFLIIRTFVLRRANSTKIVFWVLPVLMVLTFFINLFFILVSLSTHKDRPLGSSTSVSSTIGDVPKGTH